MTSKKEEAAKEAPAPTKATTSSGTDDLASKDQKEMQEMAKKIVEDHAEGRAVEAAPDPYEEAHEMAMKVVEHRHDTQTTVGPAADD